MSWIAEQGTAMAAHFRAPWGAKLWIVTLAFLGLFAFVAWRTGPPASYGLLVIVIGASTFMVRGYSVVDGKLLVHRLGWSTKFDLAKLTEVEYSPGATLGSVRVMGVGGLFGFIGRFRNETLGMYRALATDSANTVVLDFAGSKVVVTPDDPSRFVTAVEAAR
ncbi:MAG: PH domain-containing protein [Acidobacteriota bacterium]|jgi:hypothetical protein